MTLNKDWPLIMTGLLKKGGCICSHYENQEPWRPGRLLQRALGCLQVKQGSTQQSTGHATAHTPSFTGNQDYWSVIIVFFRISFKNILQITSIVITSVCRCCLETKRLRNSANFFLLLTHKKCVNVSRRGHTCFGIALTEHNQIKTHLTSDHRGLENDPSSLCLFPNQRKHIFSSALTVLPGILSI